MLIQEIDSIIESIVEPNYFLTSQNTVVPLSKKATQSLNCYAYALGITFSGNSKQHYFPGFTIQKFPLITPKLLCKFFTIDLKNLGIRYRKIGLDESTDIMENEYLIKLFYSSPNSYLPDGDFHFVRQDPKSKLWFHKLGWKNQPELVQSCVPKNNTLLGTEPIEFDFVDSNNNLAYKLEPICYFAISYKN